MPHCIIFTHLGNPLVRFFFFRQIKTITVQYLNAKKIEKKKNENCLKKIRNPLIKTE